MDTNKCSNDLVNSETGESSLEDKNTNENTVANDISTEIMIASDSEKNDYDDDDIYVDGDDCDNKEDHDDDYDYDDDEEELSDFAKDELLLKEKQHYFDDISRHERKKGVIYKWSAQSKRDVVFWVLMFVFALFPPTSIVMVYCLWRKLKLDVHYPKQFRWIPTYGKLIPKDKEATENGVHRYWFDKFFTLPSNNTRTKKWLSICGVFSIVIGVGLYLQPFTNWIEYGLSSAVIWQLIQCLCIIVGGSFLIRGSGFLSSLHTAQQNLFIVAEKFNAAPLEYLAHVVGLSKTMARTELQEVIDFGALGKEAYFDYTKDIYLHDTQKHSFAKKDLRHMCESIKESSKQLNYNEFASDCMSIAKNIHTMIEKSFETENYEYAAEYASYYLPFTLSLVDGFKSIDALEPEFDEEFDTSNFKSRKQFKKFMETRSVLQVLRHGCYTNKSVGTEKMAEAAKTVAEEVQNIVDEHFC